MTSGVRAITDCTAPRRGPGSPLLWPGNAYSTVYHDVLHWPLQERRG